MLERGEVRDKILNLALEMTRRPDMELKRVLGRDATLDEGYFFIAQVARTFVTAGYGFVRVNSNKEKADEFIAYFFDQVVQGLKHIGYESEIIHTIKN